MKPNGLITALALSIIFASYADGAGDPVDYSKEPFVIEGMTTKVSFSPDGIRDWQQTLSVRIQSEAAVRQFGVLSFAYGSQSERLKVEYVRVRKTDGSIVDTPDSNIQDVATEIAAAAPTYSDLRQKQVPVKALGVGDVLEYSVQSSGQKPEMGGQFWYTEYFVTGAVVLNQTLEIKVPKERFVQVSSPGLKPETHDDGGERVYLWHHTRLEPSGSDSKKKPVADEESPKVQVTSFRNWEEVGNWWGTLASAQAVVTPAIADKAKELTAGLTSDVDKAKALYDYVSLKYRYISISLGVGQYRPHTAAEVLANQYGDCKDKHTLFVALLKGAGIQAWPALIGAGMKPDAAVPSPAQFSHVITVMPEKGHYIWLDTTAEVAPFGLLVQSIRDQPALVIPAEGKPLLMRTPLVPPFRGSDTLDVKASLDANGTLAAHFDYRLEGDSALSLRGAFRQLAPTQWQALAQQISYNLNFAGDVSGVEVENLENTSKPFHYGYDYNRKDYSDWAEHKITQPLPPLTFGPGEDADKPDEPFSVGFPGSLRYRASIQLPKGFAVEMPKDVLLKSPFADYSASYSLSGESLSVDRHLVIKQAKVPLDEWTDYQNFSKGLRNDQTTFITLSDSTPATAPDYNPDAESLVQQAGQRLQAEKFNEAHDLLAQAERLDPKQAGLWGMNGFIAMRSGNVDQAIEDGRKEIRFHPDEMMAYRQLATLLKMAGRNEEAIETWRSALNRMPEDSMAAAQLANLLIEAKRYSEVPALLERPIAAATPQQLSLRVQRVQALLLGGRTTEGISEAKGIADVTSDPLTLNNLAFYLSEAGVDTGSAKAWAERAVSQTEQTAASANPMNVEIGDLAAVSLLAAEWDTLGWIYFQQNDLAKAEKYVTAAWLLGEHGDVANHLGQIYEKRGQRAKATHAWQLALAADHKNQEAQDYLRKAGQATNPIRSTEPAEELGTLRTIKIPGLPKQTGSAEFFVLVSRNGIESAQLIGESFAFKDTAPAIRQATCEFPFPDQGPERLLRRGILSCSEYTTPSCQLTLLLPSTTTLASQNRQNHADNAGPDSAITTATLRSKVKPEYSQDALAAHLEGKVLLSIVVNQEGIPEDVAVLKPLGMGLDENAAECVKKWRFNPAMKDGKPVKLRAKVEVNFQLQKPPL